MFALIAAVGLVAPLALAGPPTGLIGNAAATVGGILPIAVGNVLLQDSCTSQSGTWSHDGWVDGTLAEGSHSGSGTSFSGFAEAGSAAGSGTSTAHSRNYPPLKSFSSADQVYVEWDQSGSGSASWTKSGGPSQTQNQGSAGAQDGAQFWVFSPQSNQWSIEASGSHLMATAPPPQPTSDSGSAVDKWSYETSVDSVNRYLGLFYADAFASGFDASVYASASVSMTSSSVTWCGPSIAAG